MKTNFTPRGIQLNKNGAIITSTIGNTHHLNTLEREHIGFRSPNKASSKDLSQRQSINQNIRSAQARYEIETQRVNSKLHLKAKAKRK